VGGFTVFRIPIHTGSNPLRGGAEPSYLAFAVHIEEMREEMERGPDEKVIGLPARNIDDSDKAGVATDD
jgi:hypothetical protein